MLGLLAALLGFLAIKGSDKEAKVFSVLGIIIGLLIAGFSANAIYKAEQRKAEILEAAMMCNVDIAGKTLQQIAQEAAIACQKEADRWNSETVEHSEQDTSQQIFRGDGFLLAYPNDWERIRQTDTESMMLKLRPPSSKGLLSLMSSINYVNSGYAETSSLETIVNDLWSSQASKSPPLELVAKDKITIGGKPAIKIVYLNDSMQLFVVFFRVGHQVYMFLAAPDSIESAEIMDALISGIQFKP